MTGRADWCGQFLSKSLDVPEAAFGNMAGGVGRQCACSLRTRLVGDGCEVCTPELAAELARYAKPPCQQCGAMTEDEATSRCMGRAAGDGCHGTDLWP